MTGAGSVESNDTIMHIRFLETAPSEAVGPEMRLAPVRKKPGFVPAVQRWSFLLPPGCETLRVGFFAGQAPDATTLEAGGFPAWAAAALQRHPDGPTALDHARFRDAAGLLNHVAAAYWVDAARFARWQADADNEAWWRDPSRLRGPSGCWREILRVPRDRQESIYWRDYPAALMCSPEVEIFPTPYCGYYGAMRDRIPAAAQDTLDSRPETRAVEHPERRGFGEAWRIVPPHNLAVIRSANSWGRMDEEQHDDYLARLRGPLEQGMDYLRENPLPSGCLSLRMQRKTDAAGEPAPEDHALGHFLSLRHMEAWAEGHETHAAIFGAAIARYKRYGAANQLRTWHEVYVLPEGGQCFEYRNCHPTTGLLRWFAGQRLA